MVSVALLRLAEVKFALLRLALVSIAPLKLAEMRCELVVSVIEIFRQLTYETHAADP